MKVVLWSLEQISDHLDDSADLILLQRDADTAVIAVSLQQDISVLLQAEVKSLRSLLSVSDQEKFLLAGRASQLVDWYKKPPILRDLRHGDGPSWE